MATSKTVEGPTPNGGVKSTMLFSNGEGNAVDESVATMAEVIEYAEDGTEVKRTILELKR
jgi:hypothetical protein